MILGIDIDDTISKTCDILVEYGREYTENYLNREATLEFTGDNSTHFYIEALYGWTKEESSKFFELYYKKFIENVTPKQDSVEIINKLHDEGHKIILITSRDNFANVNARVETEKWLQKQGIKYDNLVTDVYSKYQACLDNKVELFIDDSYKNCMEMASNGIEVFMVDAKYNYSLNDEKIRRVYSWKEIYSLINSERK
jgi:uncharacterized HAD superfamily protein